MVITELRMRTACLCMFPHCSEITAVYPSNLSCTFEISTNSQENCVFVLEKSSPVYYSILIVTFLARLYFDSAHFPSHRTSKQLKQNYVATINHCHN